MTDLQFKWRKTWEDSENDFSGMDGDRTIGRFYLKFVPGGDKWFWSMQADWEGVDRNRATLAGIADTAREAASLIELNYLRSLGGKDRQDSLVIGHDPNKDG